MLEHQRAGAVRRDRDLRADHVEHARLVVGRAIAEVDAVLLEHRGAQSSFRQVAVTAEPGRGLERHCRIQGLLVDGPAGRNAGLPVHGELARDCPAIAHRRRRRVERRLKAALQRNVVAHLDRLDRIRDLLAVGSRDDLAGQLQHRVDGVVVAGGPDRAWRQLGVRNELGQVLADQVGAGHFQRIRVVVKIRSRPVVQGVCAPENVRGLGQADAGHGDLSLEGSAVVL